VKKRRALQLPDCEAVYYRNGHSTEEFVRYKEEFSVGINGKVQQKHKPNLPEFCTSGSQWCPPDKFRPDEDKTIETHSQEDLDHRAHIKGSESPRPDPHLQEEFDRWWNLTFGISFVCALFLFMFDVAIEVVAILLNIAFPIPQLFLLIVSEFLALIRSIDFANMPVITNFVVPFIRLSLLLVCETTTIIAGCVLRSFTTAFTILCVFLSLPVYLVMSAHPIHEQDACEETRDSPTEKTPEDSTFNEQKLWIFFSD
jgi:hypothetical protein